MMASFSVALTMAFNLSAKLLPSIRVPFLLTHNASDKCELWNCGLDFKIYSSMRFRLKSLIATYGYLRLLFLEPFLIWICLFSKSMSERFKPTASFLGNPHEYKTANNA